MSSQQDGEGEGGGILYIVLLKHFLWCSFPQQCLFLTTKGISGEVSDDRDEDEDEEEKRDNIAQADGRESSNKTTTAILSPTNFIHFIGGAAPNITVGQMFSAGFCKHINIL